MNIMNIEIPKSNYDHISSLCMILANLTWICKRLKKDQPIVTGDYIYDTLISSVRSLLWTCMIIHGEECQTFKTYKCASELDQADCCHNLHVLTDTYDFVGELAKYGE